MKIVSLISSGIDSPVATHLFCDKVEEIVLVHGDIRPFTDERELINYLKLVDHLKKKCARISKSYIIPHGRTLTSYKDKCISRYTCVFCKRMLLRYAEEIAKKEGASAIVMGDSLGQVASQTLQNIKVIDNAVSIPILRPLIGFDKEDIIQIARDIGTYDLSIAPSVGCTAVPSDPATRSVIDKVVIVLKLVNDAVSNARLIIH